MKKVILIIMIFLLLINIPLKVKAEDIAREARYVLVMDSSSKQVLYEKNGYSNVPMASTTKILTALIGISTTNEEEEFEVSKNAQCIRGSKVGYKAGEIVSVDELLHGLMFKSGNDAAITLSEGIATSETDFTNLMNHFAHSLGLINSNFETVHGLDSNSHYTSCYDLAYLTAKAMENQKFLDIVSSKEVNREDFTRAYTNINKILWRIPEANGVKTGYTGQAGKCLVSSVNYKDRNIIIVVLNCNERWKVTERLFNYVKENYDFHTLNLTDIDESLSEENKDKKIKFSIKKGSLYDAKVNEYKKFNSNEIQKVIKIFNKTTNEELIKSII